MGIKVLGLLDLFVIAASGLAIIGFAEFGKMLTYNKSLLTSPLFQTEYCNSHPISRRDNTQVTTRGDRRSALVEGVTAFMNLMNAYHKYTK